MSLGGASLVLFITMFVFVFLVQVKFIQRSKRLSKTLVGITFLGALLCIGIGLYMAIGWTDPFAGVDTTRASASHGGRGGIIVLLIRFWPYALIAYGLYAAYNFSFPLRRLFFQK